MINNDHGNDLYMRNQWWRTKDLSLIEITSYKKLKVSKDYIREFTLDIPKKNYNPEKEPIGFMGWIIGTNYKFDKIEVVANGEKLLVIPIDLKRPDVAQKYHGNPGGDMVGFFKYINPFLLPQKFNINLYAIAADTTRIKLYEISGARKALGTEPQLGLSPLVLTTLGRTGSTHAVAALGSHPEIVAYKIYQAEARFASYWAQMFFSLGNPQSWMCPMASYDRAQESWFLGEKIKQPFHFGLYPETYGWFHEEYLANLYHFSMNSLQGHYQKVAEIQKKRAVRFYCEKFLPNEFTERFIHIVPTAKEIFLVRDFRDMFCSIRAFNKRRGFNAFGRETFDNDEDFIASALKDGVEMLLSAWKKRNGGAFLLRYEDLIQKPQQTLEATFKYLGVDYSRRTVKRVLKNAKKTNPKNQKVHTTSQNHMKSVNRFETDLEANLLKLCNESFEAALVAFDYKI